MSRPVEIRSALLCGLILVGGVGLARAAPAGAATGSVTCGQGRQPNAGTLKFSDCTDKRTTGGRGTVPALQFGTPQSTITWAAGGTTTVSIKWMVASKVPRACPEKTLYFVEGTGTVFADTGSASSITVGGAVHAKVCLGPRARATLEPGTRFRV